MTRNCKPLVDQVSDRMRPMRAWGESRHAAKDDGTAAGKIFSYKTYSTYYEACCGFAKWCRREHPYADDGARLRTLDQCRPYADEWLRGQVERGRSAWTVQMRRSALRKLYQDASLGRGIDCGRQSRAAAKRSRGHGGAVRGDGRFSEANHADLVAFCRATGLRRREVGALMRDNPVERRGGALYLLGVKGKGGKVRDVRVLDEAAVRRVLDGRHERAWPGGAPRAADVHSWRAAYAAALYRELARDPRSLPPSERYCCRGDRAGTWYDRAALAEVSRSLGHNRVSVVAQSYLWQL